MVAMKTPRILHNALLGFAPLLVLFVLLSAPGAVAQQSWPPLDGSVADGTGKLNHARINTAAKDLQALGVKPLAIMVHDLMGYEDGKKLTDAAPEQYGYATNGVWDPNAMVLLYVE